jgi:hypothetical protein
MQGIAEKAVADNGVRMGRPPLGSTAADTKKTHVRLEASMLADIERVRGPRTMAAYLREAVAEKLAREGGKDG